MCEDQLLHLHFDIVFRSSPNVNTAIPESRRPKHSTKNQIHRSSVLVVVVVDVDVAVVIFSF